MNDWLCCRLAIRRALTAVKNAIVRNRDDKLRKSSVEGATERVQQVVEQVLDSADDSSLLSPGRVSRLCALNKIGQS